MKSVVLILLTFLLLNSCQKSNNHSFCGSEFCSAEGKLELINLSNQMVDSDTLVFKVKIWNASEITLQDLQIDSIMYKTNMHFKTAKIQFSILEIHQLEVSSFNLDEIYNSRKLEKKYRDIYKDNSAINLIILPKGTFLNGYTKVLPERFYRYINRNFNTIHITDKAWFNTSTLPHELGHFFGLQHTFGASPNENSTDEKPDFSNCSTSGDFICDTPADPNGLIDNQCRFIGLSNAKNTNFSPDTHNFMSYYLNKCKYRFSPLQNQRMYLFAKEYRKYLTLNQPNK